VPGRRWLRRRVRQCAAFRWPGRPLPGVLHLLERAFINI
jgi:hypothetical protein